MAENKEHALMILEQLVDIITNKLQEIPYVPAHEVSDEVNVIATLPDADRRNKLIELFERNDNDGKIAFEINDIIVEIARLDESLNGDVDEIRRKVSLRYAQLKKRIATTTNICIFQFEVKFTGEVKRSRGLEFCRALMSDTMSLEAISF